MLFVSNMELKLSAFIIAIFELIWAATVTFDKGGRLAGILQLYGLREEFSSMMAASSMCILLGCMFPCRKLRHAGLWITAFAVFPAFGLMVDNNMTSSAAFSLPFIGLMALFIFYVDVRGKPRQNVEKMDS